MSIGKKEVKLLIVFGVLVYGLLFYLIFVNSYLPQLNDVNGKLSVAEKQEKLLKSELNGIEQKKADLESKTVMNERMDNYILDAGDVTDCIQYMEKLEKLMNGKLSNVSINPPAEKSTNPDKKSGNTGSTSEDEKLLGEDESAAAPSPSASGQNYYEMAVSFDANLSYNEVTGLVNYIEDGSRRVRISGFSLQPFKATAGSGTGTAKTAATPTPTPANTDGGTLFSVKMTINLYSAGIGNLDKLYDYSRNKFSGLDGSGGVSFMVAPDNGGADGAAVSTGTGAAGTAGSGTGSGDADIIVNETGYLTAGENLEIYSIDKSVFRNKTSGKTNIQLALNGSAYELNIGYAVGKERIMRGTLPGRDLKVYIRIDVPDTKENSKIGVDFKVVNNSPYKVNVALDDKGGRASIMERSGAVVRGESGSEKLSIS